MELSPGPSVVDPTRTIAAPYSQSNRRVARIFRGGGGGAFGQWRYKLVGGVRGHAPPGKFQNFWIALDYNSRVFMVEKENVQ